jgi:hypothetical protein
MNAKFRDKRSQLRDDEASLALAAEGQRLFKLRSVIALAGLDLREFGHGGRRAKVASDSRPLRLQAEP